MVGDIIDTMANLEYGIFIAIVLDALLLVVLASLDSRKQFNALSYIIAALLLVPLTFQMSRLVGAYDISRAASTVTDLVGIVSPSLRKYISSNSGGFIGWFIFRRILWSVIFIGVAGFCIYVTMDKKRSRSHGTPNGIQLGRRYNSNTSRRRR